MSLFRKIFGGAVGRFLARLRFPWLFVFTLGVFLADLAIPDGLPLADEILLAVGSLILGNLKKRVTEGRDGGEAGEGRTGAGEVESGVTDADRRIGQEPRGGGTDAGS